MTVQELSSIHKGRDVVFNVLSRVLIDIPDAVLDEVVTGTSEYLIAMGLESENEDFRKGAEMLNEFLNTDMESNREDRARDYTRLFVIGKDSVPIYESVYTSPEHIMKQDSWAQVKAAYYENFFRRAETEKTAEDHASMELQFMGLLSKRAGEHTDNGDYEEAERVMRVQLQFYKEHLEKWFPRFCDLTTSKAGFMSTSFYPAYAYILKGFLSEDVSFLESVLED